MTYKLSNYNFEVEHDEHVLLYNGLSDKLLPVSYEEFSALETLLEHLDVFEKMYPDLFNAFKKAGFIIDGDFDELAFIRLQNKKTVYNNRDYHITINPTLDCNLKCWYCSVDYAGTKHDKSHMSSETIEALKNHIMSLIVDRKADSILLDWFGGEPTMFYDEVIKPISLAIIPEIEKYGINFKQQITSNGTLFNEERLREMKEFKFNFFQISTDGNEKQHNKVKYFADKSGSYKKVFENINLITDILPNAAVILRINYDKQTLKNITDIIDDLSENSKKRVSVDFQKIWQIKITDKERILLDEAKKEFEKKGLYSHFWVYKPRRFKRCYSDSFSHYVINYNAKVFKCTARDYSDNILLGTLMPSGKIEWDKKRQSDYFGYATFDNPMCEKCKVLPLCMGPCIQKAYEAKKAGHIPACVLGTPERELPAFIIDMAKMRKLI